MGVLGVVFGNHVARTRDSTSDNTVIIVIDNAQCEFAGGADSAPTVLFVDDEESVRKIATTVLSRAGIDVLCAANGGEAIKVFRENVDRVSLVILDLTLPDIHGDQVLERLGDIRPDVSVLLSSGYASSDSPSAGRAIVGFLQKPYLPRKLLDETRAALVAKSHGG